MISGEKYKYIHFPKTGGNSVRGYLRKYEDANENYPFHYDFETAQETVNYHTFTSIRNPFSWYVSYWNVTRNGKGTLAQTASRFNALNERFQRFGSFLRFFLVDYKSWSYRNIWNPLGNLNNGISFDLGAYSTGLLNMIVPNEFNWYERKNIRVAWSLHQIDDFIRTENLHDDLRHVIVDKLGYDSEPFDKHVYHRNKKKKQYDSWKTHYTPELVDLVKEKDGFILNKFGYIYES